MTAALQHCVSNRISAYLKVYAPHSSLCIDLYHCSFVVCAQTTLTYVTTSRGGGMMRTTRTMYGLGRCDDKWTDRALNRFYVVVTLRARTQHQCVGKLHSSEIYTVFETTTMLIVGTLRRVDCNHSLVMRVLVLQSLGYYHYVVIHKSHRSRSRGIKC